MAGELRDAGLAHWAMHCPEHFGDRAGTAHHVGVLKVRPSFEYLLTDLLRSLGVQITTSSESD